MAGTIVILNGAPRAGKSSLAAAIQAAVPGNWINWGVDAFNATLPSHLFPGIGLRPGGELPELEPTVRRLYAAYFTALGALADQDFDVVADLGLHADYAAPFDAYALMRKALADRPLLVVGVGCSIETIMARRAVAPRGNFDPSLPGIPAPILRWQDAVHAGHDYDLWIDSDAHDPQEAAKIVAAHLPGGKNQVPAAT